MKRSTMMVVALFITVAIFAGRVGAQTGVYTLQISATNLWTDTGINLSSGWQLNITATGFAIYNAFETGGALGANANGGDVSGKNFFSDAALPGAEIHSLIGKLGGTTSVGTGTAVPEGRAGFGAGFVGTSYSQVMTTSGRLFLGYNDEPFLYDNAGGFGVTITVVPEPSSLILAGMGTLILLGARMIRWR